MTLMILYLCAAPDFVVAKETPTIEANLQWKLFMLFATISVGGMAVFSLFLPETKGCSLEEVRVLYFCCVWAC